jgi:hypothetical protein
MTPQDFIKLEAEVIRIVQKKDEFMVWKAVESGAFERVRLYAERLNYDVTLEEILLIIWAELCYRLPSGQVALTRVNL